MLRGISLLQNLDHLEDDDLEVAPRERSDSAPACSQPISAAVDYPQPRYDTQDGISEHFADLDPCSSPPPFSSAFLHAREEVRKFLNNLARQQMRFCVYSFSNTIV